MANTTNLNLVKLSGSEKMKTYPSNQSGNMDTIDSAFGAGFGLSGKPNVNTSINNLADGLAIVANGNTHAAITSGQYVYVRNHGSLSEGLYVATANISANGTLSGSNVTADTSGGLNSVYSSLNSKVNKLNTSNDINNNSTLANLKSSLLSIASNMETNGEKSRYIWFACTESPFSTGIPVDGYLTIYNANYFTCLASSVNGHAFMISYNNGTWKFEELALNDKKIHHSTLLSHQFNVPNNSFNLFLFASTGASRVYVAAVYKAQGDITLFEISKGNNVTVSTSGSTLTITLDASYACDVRTVNVYGDSITG